MYKSRIEKAKEKSNREIQQAKREAKEMIDNIKKSAVDYINELYGTRCTRLDKIINIQPKEENNTKKTKGGKKKVKEEFDPLKI